ncbi:MAG: hypothetical protein ACHQ53_12515 [Polyangiales bacterium]
MASSEPVTGSIREHLSGALAASPLLAGFSASERELIAQLLTPVRLGPGQKAVGQGNHDRDLYFCVSGRAVVRATAWRCSA